MKDGENIETADDYTNVLFTFDIREWTNGLVGTPYYTYPPLYENDFKNNRRETVIDDTMVRFRLINHHYEKKFCINCGIITSCSRIQNHRFVNRSDVFPATAERLTNL